MGFECLFMLIKRRLKLKIFFLFCLFVCLSFWVDNDLKDKEPNINVKRIKMNQKETASLCLLKIIDEYFQ